MTKYIKKSLGAVLVVAINLFLPVHILFGATADTPSLMLISEKATDGVVLKAILKDSRGNPIPDEPIYFSTLTSFGPLKLKSLPTDEDGSASLLISGSDRRGEFIVEANFKGDERYRPANAKENIKLSEYKQKEVSSLRLPLPFFISFSQLIHIMAPKNLDVLLYSGENGDFSSVEIPPGTSITPYPSLELVSMLSIIFVAIWSIYFYVIKQILNIKR